MTILAPTPKRTYARLAEAIPPLENGDRLTWAEFERRYTAMPEEKKAQLIEGVVYMSSPVSNEYHGMLHFDLIIWLGFYRSATPGVRGGDNSTLRLDKKNAPQPDAFLYILPENGGKLRRAPDEYMVGAPELIAEVSASSASVDLNDKFEAYQRNGAQEYVVWRVYDQAIDWFMLRDGRYEPHKPDNGVHKSEVFPGLWLDAAALIANDMATVAKVAQTGLATPEHAAFVARLQKAAASTQS